MDNHLLSVPLFLLRPAGLLDEDWSARDPQGQLLDGLV